MIACEMHGDRKNKSDLMLKLEATNKNVEQCMNLTNYSNELTQKRIIDLRAANEAIHAEVHDKSRKI